MAINKDLDDLKNLVAKHQSFYVLPTIHRNKTTIERNGSSPQPKGLAHSSWIKRIH